MPEVLYSFSCQLYESHASWKRLWCVLWLIVRLRVTVLSQPDSLDVINVGVLVEE